MQKLFILLIGVLLLAAGCGTSNIPTTSETPPLNTATTESCPNASSKPCNGQLPTETPPTTKPPAQTNPAQQAQPTVISPAPESGLSELTLAVGQTEHPTNADTIVTLQTLSANTATIRFGCKYAPAKTFTLQLKDSISLKPNCVTALTLVKINGATAVFQISLVK